MFESAATESCRRLSVGCMSVASAGDWNNNKPSRLSKPNSGMFIFISLDVLLDLVKLIPMQY